MLLRNLIEATSRLSTSSVVLVSRYMWASSNVIASPRPSAVLFMATEMLAESIAAFSAGFTAATAAKALIRPMTVPSRPISMPTLASVAR